MITFSTPLSSFFPLGQAFQSARREFDLTPEQLAAELGEDYPDTQDLTGERIVAIENGAIQPTGRELTIISDYLGIQNGDHNQPPSSPGEIVTAARRTRGWSQSRLADEVHKASGGRLRPNQGYVRAWEGGRISPRYWTYLATVLGLKGSLLQNRDYIGPRTIGERVTEERLGKGLTRKELAEAIGVSEETVYSIEKRGMSPGYKAAPRLAGFFGWNAGGG